MQHVKILPAVVRKTICVQMTESDSAISTAFLLGKSGEQLRRFALTAQNNELALDGIAAGAYTLRIEAGAEVIVQQILIP